MNFLFQIMLMTTFCLLAGNNIAVGLYNEDKTYAGLRFGLGILFTLYALVCSLAAFKEDNRSKDD